MQLVTEFITSFIKVELQFEMVVFLIFTALKAFDFALISEGY